MGEEELFDSQNCFVIMPTGLQGEYSKKSEANYLFEKIFKIAIERVLGENSADLEVRNLQGGAIGHRIIKKLFHYDFSLVDITGANPNVFFELGVRHALRRSSTIILRQEETRIPFDISPYRVLTYDPFKPDEAIELIESALGGAKQKFDSNTRTNDSIVTDALGNYDVFVRKGEENTDMPWDVFFSRLDTVSDLLKIAARSGNYQPDLVLGISYGGMIVADFLHRLGTYKGETPYFSLWADRTKKGRYFHHPTNRELIQSALNASKKDKNEFRILLVDDNVSGGDTSTMARELSLDFTPHVRFLPLFFGRSEILDEILSYIVWSHPALSMQPEEILNLCHVQYRNFPYFKPVSGHHIDAP